jgi:hypothetical protein
MRTINEKESERLSANYESKSKTLSLNIFENYFLKKPQRQDWLWGPPSLIYEYNGYLGCLSRRIAAAV